LQTAGEKKRRKTEQIKSIEKQNIQKRTKYNKKTHNAYENKLFLHLFIIKERKKYESFIFTLSINSIDIICANVAGGVGEFCSAVCFADNSADVGLCKQ